MSFTMYFHGGINIIIIKLLVTEQNTIILHSVNTNYLRCQMAAGTQQIEW